MTTKRKLQAARRRVKRAQNELVRAGMALQQLIKATDDELSEAADSLADIRHDASADGWAGAEWEQMVAEKVIDDREADAEEAEQS